MELKWKTPKKKWNWNEVKNKKNMYNIWSIFILYCFWLDISLFCHVEPYPNPLKMFWDKMNKYLARHCFVNWNEIYIRTQTLFPLKLTHVVIDNFNVFLYISIRWKNIWKWQSLKTSWEQSYSQTISCCLFLFVYLFQIEIILYFIYKV